MNTDPSTPVPAPKFGEILLGLLPFALLCTGVVLQEMPFYQARPTSIAVLASIWAFLGGFLVILAALFYAWLKEFPRWSMPYLGYGLIFTLYMFFVATPGLKILGIEMWGREMWGVRACAPLGLVVLLGVLLKRPPWKSLFQLFRNIWNDWTFLAFSMYGFLPLLLPILQDEMNHAYSFWPTVIAALVVVAGAVLYLIFAPKRYRAAFLFGGMFLAVLSVSIGSKFYWRTHTVNMQTFEVTPLSGPAPWLPIITESIIAAGLWTLFLALTWIVGFIHKQATKPAGGAPSG